MHNQYMKILNHGTLKQQKAIPKDVHSEIQEIKEHGKRPRSQLQRRSNSIQPHNSDRKSSIVLSQNQDSRDMDDLKSTMAKRLERKKLGERRKSNAIGHKEIRNELSGRSGSNQSLDLLKIPEKKTARKQVLEKSTKSPKKPYQNSKSPDKSLLDDSFKGITNV